MKLEAIREDRTRGGRSTYQCSYTLPNSMLSPALQSDGSSSGGGGNNFPGSYRNINGPLYKIEVLDGNSSGSGSAQQQQRQSIPTLLQVSFFSFII